LGEENLENVFGRAERCFAEVSALPGPVSIAIAAPIGTWHAGASGTAGGRPGVPARQLVDRTVDPTVRALLACLPGVAFPGFRAARCGRRGRGWTRAGTAAHLDGAGAPGGVGRPGQVVAPASFGHRADRATGRCSD